MVVGEVITAIFRYRIQPVIGQLWKSLAGCHTGAVELVIRIVHLVTAENGLQTAFVEGFVVGDEGQTLNQRPSQSLLLQNLSFLIILVFRCQAIFD